MGKGLKEFQLCDSRRLRKKPQHAQDDVTWTVRFVWCPFLGLEKYIEFGLPKAVLPSSFWFWIRFCVSNWYEFLETELGPPKSCIANLFVVFRFSPFLLGCTRHTNPSQCKSFFCDSVTNAHRAKANQHGRPMWFGYDGARRGLGRKRIGKQSEACNPDVGFLSCDLRPLVRCFLCWRNANLAGTFACRRCVAWFLFFSSPWICLVAWSQDVSYLLQFLQPLLSLSKDRALEKSSSNREKKGSRLAPAKSFLGDSPAQATFTNPSLLRATLPCSATPWCVLIQLPTVIENWKDHNSSSFLGCKLWWSKGSANKGQ